jgi:hypothetical protein
LTAAIRNVIVDSEADLCCFEVKVGHSTADSNQARTLPAACLVCPTACDKLTPWLFLFLFFFSSILSSQFIKTQ